MHAQVVSKPNVAGLFDRLVVKELPGRRGIQAWQAVLRAHATLVRRLDLYSCAITRHALGSLQQFRRLEALALRGTQLEAADVAELRTALPACRISF